MFFVLTCSLTLCLGELAPVSVSSDYLREEARACIEACNRAIARLGVENPDEKTYIVEDLSGNRFYIQRGHDGGFAVYDPISNEFLERSSEMVVPFDFDRDSNYLYLGPFNYYEKIGNEYYSIFDDCFVTEDYVYSVQEMFDSQIESLRSSSIQSFASVSAENSQSNRFYIDNYEFVRDAIHPENIDDCGYVAASIVLNYWHNTMYSETILPQYLDENGNLNDTGSIYDPDTNLKDRLLEFNGGTRGSWGATIKSALAAYCKMAGLKYETHWYPRHHCNFCV